MKEFVEIDEVLDLFGCSDWEIDAKETIKEAWYLGKLKTIPLTEKDIEFLESMK